MKVIVVSVSELQHMLDKQAERIISAIALNSEKENTSLWLDIEGLIKYHPKHPARKTVYQWMNTCKIPFHRKGRKVYFLKSEISAWLAEGKCQTQPEVTNEADTNLSNQ